MQGLRLGPTSLGPSGGGEGRRRCAGRGMSNLCGSVRDGKLWDVIVLDPPKLAPRRCHRQPGP
jgi:hypothetical protein